MVLPLSRLTGGDQGALRLTGIESFFPELEFPAKGITFLYGARNAAYAYISSLEFPPDEIPVVVDVKVDIGNWVREKLSLEPGEGSLSNTRMLNLSSARSDIIDVALQVRRDACKDRVEPGEGWPKGATRLPWLAGVLVEQPGFSRLSVIVYQVAHEKAGKFQVATVFDKKAIDIASASSNVSTELRFRL